jgi:hypothetical protein
MPSLSPISGAPISSLLPKVETIALPWRPYRRWSKLLGRAPNAPRCERAWFPPQQRRRNPGISPVLGPQQQLPKPSHRPWRQFHYHNGSQSEALREWFPPQQRLRRPALAPSPPPQVPLPKQSHRAARPIFGHAPNAPLTQRDWYPSQRKRFVIAPAPPPTPYLPIKLQRGWTFNRRRVKWMPPPRRRTYTVAGASGSSYLGPLQVST